MPPVTTDAEGRVMVMARLFAPADTLAQLFYTYKANAFNERQSVKVAIKKGENFIHLSCFGEPKKTMYLRFDPGSIPGEYRFLPLNDVHQLKEESYGF